MFPRSIKENIIYPFEYNVERYLNAIKQSQLETLINKLPNGIVSYSDDNFSGGEIQRIKIANAIYRDAAFYLFNEVTSALDVKTEKEIMSFINTLKDKIVLIVSHRVYTLLKCDKIIVIKEGKIIEYGECDKLLNDKTSQLKSLLKITK